VTGGPVPVVEGVMGAVNSRGRTNGAAQFSFSRNGSLIYVVGEDSAQTEDTLVWVDRQGKEEPLGAPPRAYRQLQLSPDGRQLAANIGESSQDIWVYDLERGALSRLTFEGSKSRPLWTPDGKHIVYLSVTDHGREVSWKAADGTGEEEEITTDAMVTLVSSISPDGKLAFYYTGPAAGRDLWMVPLEGDRKPSPFLKGPFNETSPKISPDGRWVAYISNESGRNEIFVRPFPASSGKWQISTDGGEAPVWARNGLELFYQNGNKMMAVNIEVGQASTPVSPGQAGRPVATFTAGTPRMLFEGNYVHGNNEALYDVSLDGKRFLMVKPGGQGDSPAPQQQINIVLNWFEELKQRVPSGR
jgi:WD40-like Beta Propeller Repeat